MEMLGSTKLPVSRLGLGLAALGRPAYITLDRSSDLGADRSVTAMEQRCHRMLADFFMPIFLGHRLVLVELMRFVQGSQPIGAGSGGGEPNAAGFVFYVAHARHRARPEI